MSLNNTSRGFIVGLIKWLQGKDDIAISDSERFIQLIRDNQYLEQKLDVMYRSIVCCGYELYKYTGNPNHLMPEHWMRVADGVIEKEK